MQTGRASHARVTASARQEGAEGCEGGFEPAARTRSAQKGQAQKGATVHSGGQTHTEREREAGGAYTLSSGDIITGRQPRPGLDRRVHGLEPLDASVNTLTKTRVPAVAPHALVRVRSLLPHPLPLYLGIEGYNKTANIT